MKNILSIFKSKSFWIMVAVAVIVAEFYPPGLIRGWISKAKSKVSGAA